MDGDCSCSVLALCPTTSQMVFDHSCILDIISFSSFVIVTVYLRRADHNLLLMRRCRVQPMTMIVLLRTCSVSCMCLCVWIIYQISDCVLCLRLCMCCFYLVFMCFSFQSTNSSRGQPSGERPFLFPVPAAVSSQNVKCQKLSGGQGFELQVCMHHRGEQTSDRLFIPWPKPVLLIPCPSQLCNLTLAKKGNLDFSNPTFSLV